MGSQLRDIICKDRGCNGKRRGVVSPMDDYPPCPRCGGVMTWWANKAPATDVYKTPQYSDASGQYHSSTREKEHVMADCGYAPAGDKTHGARTEYRLNRAAFSYVGQIARTSTGEGK